MASTADWLDSHRELVIARQRASADGAKLITTFATGVSATILAVALEEPARESFMFWLTLITFGVGTLLCLLVFFADRVSEADSARALENAAALGSVSEESQLRELRRASLTAVYANEELVRAIRTLALVQVAVAIICVGLLVTWLTTP